MEKLERNRLIEDSDFYDRIRNKILDELENLSKTFDDQVTEWASVKKYGETWKERMDKIKAGEKLGVEPAIREIVIKIAQESGLSNIELSYLLNLIFKPRRQRITND